MDDNDSAYGDESISSEEERDNDEKSKGQITKT